MNAMVDGINKIIKLISRKPDFSITLSSKCSDFTTQLYPPLQFESGKWVVGLISLDTYYTIPNISTKNNTFKYSTDNGTTWKVITINTGSYEITQINSEIKRLMLINGDSGIDIILNAATFGSVVNITAPNYQVDFTVQNSLASTLGFTPIILTQGYNESPNVVNIMSVNSILVNCSIIGNSYLNSTHFPILYSFFPNVKPGHKIVQQPSNVVYLPLNAEYVPNIRIWVTDESGNVLNFRGEEITCRLQFKYL